MSFKYENKKAVVKQIAIRIVVGLMLFGEFLGFQKGASFFKGDNISPSVSW